MHSNVLHLLLVGVVYSKPTPLSSVWLFESKQEKLFKLFYCLTFLYWYRLQYDFFWKGGIKKHVNKCAALGMVFLITLKTYVMWSICFKPTQKGSLFENHSALWIVPQKHWHGRQVSFFARPLYWNNSEREKSIFSVLCFCVLKVRCRAPS